MGPWCGHLPFAHDLIVSLRPEVIVELGTHYGESYFGFCQSVEESRLPARCFAVDTWRGDEHAGFYGDEVFQNVDAYNRASYAAFSCLIRATFDEAACRFADQSIDLLHIDGLHTFDAVAHDFHTWVDKVKPGGVVLFHDVIARAPGFEVWRFWDAISRRFPSFTFFHSWGLGVLRVPGPPVPDDPLLQSLFSSGSAAHQDVRQYYTLLAENLTCRLRLTECGDQLKHTARLKLYRFASGGYREASSLSALVNAGAWERVSFELTGEDGQGPLRIDPCETPALVDIAEVRIVTRSDGHVVWAANEGIGFQTMEPGGDLLILSQSDHLRCFSYGFDPQLLLPRLPESIAESPLQLEVCLRIDPELANVTPFLNSNASEPAGDALRTATGSAASDELSHASEQLRSENEALRTEILRYETEQFTLASELQALTAGHASLCDELARARRELDLANERLQALQREQEALGQQFLDSQGQHRIYERRLLRSGADLENLRQQNRSLQDALQTELTNNANLRASWSWHITSPLRWAARRFNLTR